MFKWDWTLDDLSFSFIGYLEWIVELEFNFLNDLESLSLDCLQAIYYPRYLKLPSTLKKLSLQWTNLPWSEISVIGKLPNLEVLKLGTSSFVGKKCEMEDEEEFLNLKVLNLFGLKFEEWISCTDRFPCLGRLFISFCDNLQEIPFNFGDISSLKEIEIHVCSDGAESSARKILNEQLELGNEDLELLVSSNACSICWCSLSWMFFFFFLFYLSHILDKIHVWENTKFWCYFKKYGILNFSFLIWIKILSNIKVIITSISFHNK